MNYTNNNEIQNNAAKLIQRVVKKWLSKIYYKRSFESYIEYAEGKISANDLFKLFKEHPLQKKVKLQYNYFY